MTGALAASALLFVACTPTVAPDPTSASGALPDGVTVSLIQLRSDVAANQAQVEVHNGTDEALMVGSLSVDDARFATAATRVLDRDSRVPAGRTVDIRIQLPEMDCAAADTSAGATLQLTYRSGDEEDAHQAEAPITDPIEFLQLLYERQCRAQAVADAAALSLAEFTPSPAGVPADLRLGIAPTGTGAVRIVGIQTTNLLTFDQSADPTGETFSIGVDVAEGDTAPITVDLPLVPFRCDPHAVQEDKRGTIFTVVVELDGEPGQIELAASEEMRGRMLTWVADWCGFGPGSVSG